MPRRHPAEWEPHSACWLAFPRLEEEWPNAFDAVCQEWANLCFAIADWDESTGELKGERLEIAVYDKAVMAAAQGYLGNLPVHYHLLPYDDIWLRDIAPTFVLGDGSTVAINFEFNVWGNQFDFPHDILTGKAIATQLNLPVDDIALVAEGGALEPDGQGTVLTTQQCLLNPNRNPALSQGEIESRLKQACGYQKILWLEDQGLINDHTDGHIDTLARFILPGVVMAMVPQGEGDPNGDRLKSIVDQLLRMTDAQGRSLQLVTIPSPGAVDGDDGELLPASYLNFYISNQSVIVPIYGSPHDDEAVQRIAACFPTRRTIGLSAKALITGGGAFHCITQQQP
jgi:agmatine deiminase